MGWQAETPSCLTIPYTNGNGCVKEECIWMVWQVWCIRLSTRHPLSIVDPPVSSLAFLLDCTCPSFSLVSLDSYLFALFIMKSHFVSTPSHACTHPNQTRRHFIPEPSYLLVTVQFPIWDWLLHIPHISMHKLWWHNNNAMTNNNDNDNDNRNNVQQ